MKVKSEEKGAYETQNEGDRALIFLNAVIEVFRACEDLIQALFACASFQSFLRG